MTGTAEGSLARVVVAIAVLIVATLLVMAAGRIGQRRDLAVSTARAFVQLSAVALVIAWIFANPEGAAAYVVLMLVAATVTAVRRIGCGASQSGWVLLAIIAGAAATVGVVLATGALARDVQAIVPFTAQIIGGAMTAALLAGSRLRDDTLQGWGEVEGYLALGASPRQAVSPMGRHAVEQALTPALDQTKSAGLVLLPGSFVGLLLGGASPARAAQVQLLVLVGLILAQVIAALLTVHFLAPAAGSRKPVGWRSPR